MTGAETRTGEVGPRAAGVGRFEARVVLGTVALLVGAVPFLGLMLLVRQQWTPLRELDDAVAGELNQQLSASSLLVDVLQVLTDFGGSAFAVYVFTLTTAWFLIRQQRRLASFVATTGIGLALLVPVTKVLVGRPRPQVPVPVVEIPANASFPSGHAMVSIVTAGMLTLVLLPAVPRRGRLVLVIGAVTLALLVGFTRLALGVHFVSDVLAGWALGAGWLAVTVAAFRAWQREDGVRLQPVSQGVDPLRVHARRAAVGEPVLPHGGTTVRQLTVVAVAILVGVSALGLLVTTLLADTALGRWDDETVRQLLAVRAEGRTDLARAVSALSGTPVVTGLSVALAVLALAVQASWRPALFVATVVLGEVLLYFLTAQIVERARPDVADLTSGLPVGASWPSGHVAAAVAVYGALAALVVHYGRARWRWATLTLPLLLPPAIGVSRIYLAAHHPTDVLAGLLLGTLWLLACARLLLKPRTTGRRGRGYPHPTPGPAGPRVDVSAADT